MEVLLGPGPLGKRILRNDDEGASSETSASESEADSEREEQQVRQENKKNGNLRFDNPVEPKLTRGRE